MKRSDFSAGKLIVFILGIGVLALAFILLAPLFELRREQYVFSCVSVSLIYLAFFLPVLLGSLRGGIDSAAAGGAVYFKGLAAYFVISAADIALSLTVLSLGISIVIQAAALFIFFVWIFMAYTAKNHIESTRHNEEIKKSPVIELRSKSQKLSAITAGLEKGSNIRVSAEKIADDMRYLSPGETKNEHDLDYRMIAVLDSIIADSYFASEDGLPPASLESKFKNFDALYRERKNMR